MKTPAGAVELTVMVMGVEVTETGLGHMALEVITQVTAEALLRNELLNVWPVAALMPLMSH